MGSKKNRSNQLQSDVLGEEDACSRLRDLLTQGIAPHPEGEPHALIDHRVELEACRSVLEEYALDFIYDSNSQSLKKFARRLRGLYEYLASDLPDDDDFFDCTKAYNQGVIETIFNLVSMAEERAYPSETITLVSRGVYMRLLGLLQSGTKSNYQLKRVLHWNEAALRMRLDRLSILGLVITRSDERDKRRTLSVLTALGEQVVNDFRSHYLPATQKSPRQKRKGRP